MTVELTEEECRMIRAWAEGYCRESHQYYGGEDHTEEINEILAKLKQEPIS